MFYSRFMNRKLSLQPRRGSHPRRPGAALERPGCSCDQGRYADMTVNQCGLPRGILSILMGRRARYLPATGSCTPPRPATLWTARGAFLSASSGGWVGGAVRPGKIYQMTGYSSLTLVVGLPRPGLAGSVSSRWSSVTVAGPDVRDIAAPAQTGSEGGPGSAAGGPGGASGLISYKVFGNA